MKVYLAARYSRKDEIKSYAEVFKGYGYTVTSRWLDDPGETWSEDANDLWTHRATIDLEDVDKADAIVSFTHPRGTPVTGGGRHVEFGYALAKGKRMIVIGPKEHVFHHLPGIEFYSTIGDMLIPQKKRAKA